MQDRDVEVTPLREEQVEQAGDLVARAFHDYPLFTLAFPDPAERSRCVPLLQRWDVRHAVLFGESFALGDPLVGVALVTPPDSDLYDDRHLAESGHTLLVDALGADTWRRWRTILDTIYEYGEQQLERELAEPHWTLEAIAVDPAQQGRGYGSLLLDAAHARADAEGRQIALLTHTPRTAPFYLRHGYTLVCEGEEPTSGLHHWGFRRTPRR